MQRIEQLIQKFWSGQASAEEVALLLNLLTEHEAELSSAEKAEFRKIKEEGTVTVNPERGNAILNKLQSMISDSQPAEINAGAKVIPLNQKRLRWYVAASAVMLLGLCFWAITKRASNEKELAVRSGSHITRTLKTVTNNTDTAETIGMEDGSVITLSAGTAVSFYKPFGDSSRNISLTGKALFDVAKDAARPFTVYSGGIATTALGTSFIVNTLSRDTVDVTLLEGKVVIQSVGKNDRPAISKVFLHPGQRFIINTITNNYTVNDQAVKEKGAAGAMARSSEIKAMKQKTTAVLLSFDHEPLQKVFKQLSSKYKAEIRFDNSDLAGLYFSGSVLKGDSLRTVMTAICNMNRLSFTEQQDYILVKKSN